VSEVTTPSLDVLVIGAGLAGLACAHRLERSGLRVRVVEAGAHPGGVVTSDREGGYLIESGPNTVVPTAASMAIVEEAGLDGEMVTAPSGSPRFILLKGRLRRAPWVLSPYGYARALAEPFVRRRPVAGDESLESFFVRRFGRQVHDRLAAPFVTGIYAGNTSRLGVEGVFPRIAELESRYGSVLAGLLRRKKAGPRYGLRSFREGMGTLPRALAGALDVRYGVPAHRVRPVPGGWSVDVDSGPVTARGLVVAVPASTAARLLAGTADDLASDLASISYAPIVVVHMAVSDTAFSRPLHGFGFLVPRGENRRVLGTLFSSCLFPGRSPRGHQLLTTFMGGALDPEIIDWSEERILETAGNELELILKLARGTARPVRVTRYPGAIPQYRVGHPEWRRRVELEAGTHAGLFLTGNYFSGVSVPATMEHGARTALAAAEFLRRTG
jgi:oxygen-dependent protoporphyrinogen oxidase